MKRLFLTLGCVVVLTGCGGAVGDGPAPSKGVVQDEASVAFKSPLLLSALLDMAHRHHVQPTELTMQFAVGSETINTHAVVESGMSDAEIERRVRESATSLTEGMEGSPMLSGDQRANLLEVQRRAREGPLRIDRMLASGSAEDLRALGDEPEVQGVALKSEILERVRRAREGR